jgi:hypothetical protein
VRYGILWTDVFTSPTEDNTFVGINNDGGFVFVVVGFCFESVHVTEFYAFATGGAFVGVYFWIPGNFVSW